ncbi:hypothetical protein [Neobacillus kokaensis]|uniref:Preprotein translocase subunit SecA n=1 Tax=Neobacillus kokaensis TaxID=2759023 RepID=A0ABQ3N220_9BACI|nr:hypothetical protein [Neobacillus kokaensis]GHH98984.1 hypothetical protein AM1BK_25270 [Neobacillus kokaensis]
MLVIHFLENKTVVLSQLVKQIPSVDENIKIKGRKGKVTNIEEVKENVYHASVIFEQVKKVQPAAKDNKSKKR